MSHIPFCGLFNKDIYRFQNIPAETAKASVGTSPFSIQKLLSYKMETGFLDKIELRLQNSVVRLPFSSRLSDQIRTHSDMLKHTSNDLCMHYDDVLPL